MSRSVEIVVLSEDRQHECFARRFLNQRGRHYRYRFATAPHGRGSGEQWVREQFPDELKQHRLQRSRKECYLLVVTDADRYSSDERIHSYREICRSNDLEFHQPGDKVAFAVPARNIESWLAYLRGESVDELSNFPRLRGHERDCEPQAATLYAMCHSGQLREPAPPSLLQACQEFARLGLE